MFVLFLIFVVSLVSIPLYLDYKKDPLNNVVTNNLKIVNENEIVKKIINPIIPHAQKYGLNELFILPIIILILFLILIVLF